MGKRGAGLHILVVSNLYPPYYLGGYELLCRDVCTRLVRSGHAVTVLTSTHGSGGEAVEELDGVGVERRLRLYQPFDRPVRSAMRLARWRTTAWNHAVTASVLEKVRPDLVFVWSQLRLTLGAAWAAQDAGFPLVFTFNDDHIKGYKPPEAALSPRAALRYLLDAVLMPRLTFAGLDLSNSTCISRNLKTKLLAQGVPVEESRVIYQGIPVERFPVKETPGELHDPPRILYAGQLHEYKGVHTLLEACIRVAHALERRCEAGGGAQRRPLLEVTIAGRGDPAYERRLESLAAEAAPMVRVTFPGRVPRDELAGLYVSHDVFVFPSIWEEPFGLTHLEAMACGTPVVSTTRGGPAEFLEDGVNALTFEADDAASLARALEGMLGRDELRRRIALAGLRTARERFSMERYVAELEDFLRDSLERRRR